MSWDITLQLLTIARLPRRSPARINGTKAQAPIG